MEIPHLHLKGAYVGPSNGAETACAAASVPKRNDLHCRRTDNHGNCRHTHTSHNDQKKLEHTKATIHKRETRGRMQILSVSPLRLCYLMVWGYTPRP